MNCVAHVLVAGVLSTACFAQVAQIVVSHNDLDGMVDPGQTIRVNLRLSWGPISLTYRLASIQGDGATTPDAGIASNPSTALNFGNPAGQLILGTPTLGSIRGFWMGQAYGPFLMPGSSNAEGLDFLWFDWQAPAQPGEYAFIFAHNPQTQGVWLFNGGGNIVKASLTVVPTSVLVTPSPATPGLLVGGLGLLVRFRRDGRSG